MACSSNQMNSRLLGSMSCTHFKKMVLKFERRISISIYNKISVHILAQSNNVNLSEVLIALILLHFIMNGRKNITVSSARVQEMLSSNHFKDK
ncbi:Hypothetical predicted protein [Podarcis lilfordi]|uniref:Uncharacterized protein n=1 Tax=Podarcis lilfordi TaxID=74358 RepID=A0AA35P6U8_9SAUR|nr:Hypothetical predicted protein [Podarcis lilfordi]